MEVIVIGIVANLLCIAAAVVAIQTLKRQKELNNEWSKACTGWETACKRWETIAKNWEDLYRKEKTRG